jgi:hypothetical protein
MTIQEVTTLISKNEDWLKVNEARRNTVYYQMVENTLKELRYALEYLEKYPE